MRVSKSMPDSNMRRFTKWGSINTDRYVLVLVINMQPYAVSLTICLVSRDRLEVLKFNFIMNSIKQQTTR